MRLFVAIELDDEARHAVAKAQQDVARTVAGSDGRAIKWVRPHHLHVTLAFLGEVPDARVADITRTIERDIRVPPFAAVLGGLGVFPTRGAPRALWLGLRDGGASVAATRREIDARLNHSGIALEPRVLHPHVTLARWRASRPADARLVSDAHCDGEIARLVVDHVTLFHSKLSAGGPTYCALTRVTLTP